MGFLRNEDFDDGLPSPFSGDLYARFHDDPSRLTVDEYLAGKWRVNARVPHDEPPTPNAYPYPDEPLALLASDYFEGLDPEPEIDRQHQQFYGLAAWAKALLNGFRRPA